MLTIVLWPSGRNTLMSEVPGPGPGPATAVEREVWRGEWWGLGEAGEGTWERLVVRGAWRGCEGVTGRWTEWRLPPGLLLRKGWGGGNIFNSNSKSECSDGRTRIYLYRYLCSSHTQLHRIIKNLMAISRELPMATSHQECPWSDPPFIFPTYLG